MRARGFGATDVGVVRSSNEDRMFLSDDLGLYLVCDGMGGHAAGEVAAEIATETVAIAVRMAADHSQQTRGHLPDYVESQEVLRDAIRRASEAVCAEAIANPDRAGMGCTITALQFVDGKALMAHVGDTRLYMVRDGAAELLSADHTYAADLVRRGEMTPTVARDHKYSNALTRCVGSQDAVQVDSLVLDVGPEDRFLICSDGLSNYLESLSELAAALDGGDAANVPEQLIRMANERGGGDNVTVIAVVMEARDEEMEQLMAISEQRRGDLRSLRALDLFASVSFADALRVLNHCEVRDYAAGEQVFEEVDRDDCLVLVLAGSFDLLGEAGAASARMRVGDHVGDTALLVAQPLRSQLVAHESGRVLVLTGQRLKVLSRRRPWLGVKMMTSLAAALSAELAAAGALVRQTPVTGEDGERGVWTKLRSMLRRR